MHKAMTFLILLGVLGISTLALAAQSFEWNTTGRVSSYGKERQGRRTSSGEIFDYRKLTAAHRTLPFGSIVLVTNTRNGKQVRVRINDRGPGYPDRIIDVSAEAARRLGFDGLTEGTIALVWTPPIASDYSYLVLACRAGQSRKLPCASYVARATPR